MKALSVRQPWASLIMSGKKIIELRTWKTKYRGPLVICASQRRHGSLPTGVALGIVNLDDIRPSTPNDEPLANCMPENNEYAWILSNPKPFVMPFAVKGKLSIFDLELPKIW